MIEAIIGEEVSKEYLVTDILFGDYLALYAADFYKYVQRTVVKSPPVTLQHMQILSYLGTSTGVYEYEYTLIPIEEGLYQTSDVFVFLSTPR